MRGMWLVTMPTHLVSFPDLVLGLGPGTWNVNPVQTAATWQKQLYAYTIIAVSLGPNIFLALAGVVWSELIMPSEAAKKRQAQKREKRQASSRSAQKRPTVQPSVGVSADDLPDPRQNGEVDGGTIATGGASSTSLDEGVEKMRLSPRSCTGELRFNINMYVHFVPVTATSFLLTRRKNQVMYNLKYPCTQALWGGERAWYTRYVHAQSSRSFSSIIRRILSFPRSQTKCTEHPKSVKLKD